MTGVLKAARLVLAAAAAVWLLPSPGSASECPAGPEVASSLEETFRKKVEVKRIQPSAVEGLCEVVVSLEGRASLIYIDRSGRYFVTGQVVDSTTRRDLSREALADFNSFSPDEIARLDELTALTLGESGPTVYFVTDPD